MNGITRRLLLVLALSASVAACASRTSERVKDVLKLQLAMTRDEVLSIMGQPDRREVHGDVEFLIYQTNTIDQTNIGDDEAWNFTPVGLVDGRVTGWGRVYYEAARASKIGPDGSISKKKT